MTYDIPTQIRAEIVEPTKIFRCVGPMPTESEVIGREENFELDFFLSYLSILDSYKKGTENHKRLGVFAKYRISRIAFEDVNDLKEEVSEALEDKLIAAHTRLIQGIIDADKALFEAMKSSDDMTLKEQDAATAAWANECRARIRAAHEELNVAVRHAENFDMTAETFDRIKGFEAATRARLEAFNALAASRHVNGVEI